MSFRRDKSYLGAAMLAAAALGFAYPLDANGYEYRPAPAGRKRPEGRPRRDGTFSKTSLVARRKMRNRHLQRLRALARVPYEDRPAPPPFAPIDLDAQRASRRAYHEAKKAKAAKRLAFAQQRRIESRAAIV